MSGGLVFVVAVVTVVSLLGEHFAGDLKQLLNWSYPKQRYPDNGQWFRLLGMRIILFGCWFAVVVDAIRWLASLL